MARRGGGRGHRDRAPLGRARRRGILSVAPSIGGRGDTSPRGTALRGLTALIGACTIWGLSPLYYAALSHVPAAEVMAHRILWSAVFFGAIVALQGRIGSVLALLGARALRVRLVASTVFVSSNWFLFIWAVQSGRTVESSLGYYIAPLMAVIVGRVYFGERLSSLRWTATALAALGVMILAAWLGAPPWVSLAIALTFTLYGVAKRGLDAPALISVLAEVLLLAPIALFWIAVMVPGKGAMVDPVDAGLLLLSGPLTALPLILFSYASRRMTLATLGVVGYLNPTLQFVGAVTILGEPVTAVHLLAFGLIWTALALYSAAAFRRERRTGGDIAAREKVATDPPPP